MRLSELSLGFREHYLDHAEITAQLRAWADAFADFVRLESLGLTPEGREIWLLTIGHEPERVRPSVLIDANMHAVELSGSSVALAIAEDVIALHVGQEPRSCVPHHVRAIVKETLFHIVPRMSPDGAEAVRTTGRYVRSVPRDERPNRAHPRWVSEDIDGDGRALYMRKEDPAGDFVEIAGMRGLLVPRTIDDAPPYYKLYPEGRIENFDGRSVPTPGFLDDSHPDLNRNFPFHFAPDPKQIGAGTHPGSEPESRAIIEFVTRTPTIFAWLNLHTFGGVFIRPPGHLPDEKMNPFDLAVYRQVGQWAESITGYPMVSGFAEFLYEADKPLHGALSEWAYEDRGALAYVCELWDLMAKIGVARTARFVDRYVRLGREDWIALARWDTEHNQGRIFQPWKAVTHPQLGEVEVGGMDRRVGLFNPSYEELPAICEAQSQLMMRVAALLPRVRVTELVATPLRDNATQITLTIENHGYLPTYGMQHAKSYPHCEPLWVDVASEGCTLEDAAASHQTIGHLEGWGQGLWSSSTALFFPHSSGSQHRRTLRYVVQGKGIVRFNIGSCRVGYLEAIVTVGESK